MLCSHFLWNSAFWSFTFTLHCGTLLSEIWLSLITLCYLALTSLSLGRAFSISRWWLAWTTDISNYFLLLFPVRDQDSRVQPYCAWIITNYFWVYASCGAFFWCILIALATFSCFSVPTPHLPKAKKQDFRKLLHNNNYSSSTDDNRVSRWVKKKILWSNNNN